MKSKILSTVLIAFMLFIGALFTFLNLRTIATEIQDYRLILSTKYTDTNKGSYLWQLALIEPNKNNMDLVLDKLIASGDYKSAKFLNILVSNPKFNLKVVENDILNQNEDTDLKYFETLNSVEKAEIKYFLELREGYFTKPPYELPTTNLGKIATMIYLDDFNLYTAENNFGAEIRKQAGSYQNKSEQRIAVANIFLNYGFPRMALGLIETTTKENPCLYQSLDLKIRIYEETNKSDELIESINNLLSCYPSNQVALEKAISVTSTQELSLESYQTRLEELKKINNK